MAEHVTVFQTSSADTETAPEMVDKGLQDTMELIRLASTSEVVEDVSR
jgi:hypothetical protein